MAALLRLRLSDDARDEARALSRSVAGHAAIVVVMALSGFLRARESGELTMPSLSARLAPDVPKQPAAAPAARPTPPAARPKPPVPAPERQPEPRRERAPEPAEPEPEPDPGVAPPREEEPPPRPKPRPREPARSSAPAPATAPRQAEPEPEASSAAESPPGTVTQVAAGVAATIEGDGIAQGDPYLAHLVTRVSSRWSKPSAGLAPKSATIYFEIGRSGRLSDIRLEDPSGVAMFDRAALRAVELSNPVPPLPPSVRGAVLRVHFRFLP